MIRFSAFLFSALMAGTALAATPVTRIGSEKSFLADAIWAGDTLYVSGQLPTANPGDAAKGVKPFYEGDTKAQTINVLQKIEGILKAQGLAMADVVQMRVYLVPDATGKLDFAGMNEAYKMYFGTKEQPNKPVRATIQAGALVVPGAWVEIEVVAVRSK